MSDHITCYAICACYVWLIAIGVGRGRCGRCGVSPEGTYWEKQHALDTYYAMHNKLPEPMRGK